jgi:putative transcriptional regulator
VNNPTPAEIKALRKKAKKTQVQAAEIVGSCRRAWQYWEKGEKPMHPGLWRLFKIETFQVGMKK